MIYDGREKAKRSSSCRAAGPAQGFEMCTRGFETSVQRLQRLQRLQAFIVPLSHTIDCRAEEQSGIEPETFF